MSQYSLFLRDKDKQKLLDLLDQYIPTVEAWAYGSRVNGEAHDASDLDLVLRSADFGWFPSSGLGTLNLQAPAWPFFGKPELQKPHSQAGASLPLS